MALDVGSVFARLGARFDDDGFDRFERRLESARRDARRDVEVDARVDVDERSFRRFDDRVEKAERSSGRLRSALGRLGPAAGIASAAVGGGAGLMAKGFVDAATDIAESTSKIETVVGKRAAGAIQAFARTSATELGISRQAALEATGTFASLFDTLGQSGEQAARSAVDFTRLAADLASFNNASPEETLTALQAGLRGEAEPLRRFGILLDDATLRQSALREGLVKTTKEALTPQQKALAAQAEIMRQAGKQHGDFERTSGGLANQQRILRARLSDVGAAIGERLLPHSLKLVTGLNRMVEQARNGEGPLIRLRNAAKAAGSVFADAAGVLRRVAGFVARNRTAFEALTAAVIAGVAAWKLMAVVGTITRLLAAYRTGALAATIAQSRLNLAMRANPIGVVVTVLAALSAALVVAYKRSDSFRRAADNAFDAVKGAARGMGRTILGVVDGILGGYESLVNAGAKLPGPLGKPFQKIGDSIRGTRDKVSELRDELEDVPKSSDKADRGARRAAKGAREAERGFGAAGSAIAGSYNALASEFDLPPVRFTPRAINKRTGGGDYRPTRRAIGGIPNPGSGGADDHLLLDPSGRPVAAMSGTEGILNRPQMGIVDAALGIANALGAIPYGGLGELWQSGLRHFATGGSIVPVPGFPGERANRSILGKISGLVRRFPGLVLTDAFGPGHKSPGHTVTGTAADFAGPDPVMDRAVRYLVGRGYLVGYDGRFGSRDWPGHGPAAGQGGSNAHLHVEFASSSGGAIETPELKRLRMSGPESMRTLLQTGADRLVAGGNRKLDGAASALAVPVAGGGSGAWDKRRLAALWRRVNGGLGDANLMAAIALAESGGRASVVNSIGAGGLWQIHPPEPGYLDPVTNARIAGRKLRTQGLRAWEAYTRGMHRKYLADGGLLRRFAGGGSLSRRRRRVRPSRRTASATTRLERTVRRLRGMQTDRVGEYDRLTAGVERHEEDYAYFDRLFAMSDEELVDEETGAVNPDAVRKRAAELEKLAAIRTAMRDKLVRAQIVAKRVEASYRTIIARLRKARKLARGKKRRSYYDDRIEAYGERLDEWGGKVRDLRQTVRMARLDAREALAEHAAVLGTTGRPADAPDVDVDAALGPDAGGELGGTPDTAPAAEPAPTPPSAEDIARGVAETLAAFQGARTELLSGFGSNAASGYGGAMPGGGLGPRHYGALGAAAGFEGGADVLGALGGGAKLGGGAVVVNNFAAPPPDPHTWTRGQAFELAAL